MQPAAQLEHGNKNAPGDEEMNYARPGELDYRELRQDRARKKFYAGAEG
jgi:hypothetical protein